MTPEQFAESLRKAAETGGFRKALIAELQAWALEAEAEAKKNATESPHARTGRLRASIAGVVRERPGVLEAAVGSGSDPQRPGVPYAAMQEEGKKDHRSSRAGGMLRIPLDAAKTAAGVDRYPTPLRISAPDKFFLWQAKSGKLFLRDKLDGSFWYILKDSVTIPGTHFLYRAISATTGKLGGSLVNLLEKVLDEAAEGVV